MNATTFTRTLTLLHADCIHACMGRKTISVSPERFKSLNEQRKSLDMTWDDFLEHLSTGGVKSGGLPVEVTVDSEEVVSALLEQVAEEGLFTVSVEAEEVANEIVNDLDGDLNPDHIAEQVSKQVTSDVEGTVEATIMDAVEQARHY